MSRSWGITRAESWDRLKADPYKRTKFKYTQEEETVHSDDIKVFVIINEWTDEDDDGSSELVGGKWFASEDDAWEALDLIAKAHDVELDPDDTSIQFKDVLDEEYRIEELTRG